MSNCMVKGCSSTAKQQSVDPLLSFHRFPSNQLLLKNWLSACKINDAVKIKYGRICNRHFTSDDYVWNGGKRHLLPDSIPSLCVPGALPETDCEVVLPLNQKLSSNFYYTVNLGDGTYIKISFTNQKETFPYPEILNVSRNHQFELNSTILEVNSTSTRKKEFTSMKNKISVLKSIIKSNRAAKAKKIQMQRIRAVKISSRINNLQRRIVTLNQDLTIQAKSCKSKLNDAKLEVLGPFQEIFSETQIRILKNRHKKGIWTTSDIAKAIALRSKSARAYKYLRSVWKLPLPAISTIQKYTKKIQFSPGILYSVLNLLKDEFVNYSEMKRQAVLSFDEMSLDSDNCYDAEDDIIYGCKKNITVAIIRGLFSTWKQPIFFSYSQITQLELKELLVNCDSVGIIVRAFVCDLGGTNRALWNALGISENRTYIDHPTTGKSVWCFPDAPHLLKLIRNNLLDYGFKLSCGKTVNKDDFKKLITTDSNEFKIQYKLTSHHINVREQGRQHVGPACELLSNRTYEAFNKIYPEEFLKWKFIKLVNDWFDIMNSRDMKERNPLKAAYGLHYEAQNKTLDAMREEIMKLRVGKSKSLYPFQRGILISINSLQGLFIELKVSSMPVAFILTHKLNQDVLENSFSVLRSIGGHNDTPTAVDAKNRLKILMLGWNFGRSENTCVKQHPIEQKKPFLSYKLLSSLFDGSHISNSEETVPDIFEDMSLDELNSERVDETNWRANVENMSKKQLCDFYGKEYVCGFIASKFKQQFPELNLVQIPNRYPQSFTENISRGGLAVPSYTFFNEFLKFEDVFVHMFRDCGDSYGIYRGKQCMETLSNKLQALSPHMPLKLIKLYVRTRVFIRIKKVNKSDTFRFRKSKKKTKLTHFLRSSIPLPEVQPENSPNFINSEMFDVFEDDAVFFEEIALFDSQMEMEAL